MDHVTECPKCHTQLKIHLSYASGPREVVPERENVGTLLAKIDIDNCDERSQTFVRETQERWEQWGTRIKMSAKQWAWLRSLADGKENF